jgi:hypothetical protein
MTRKKTKEDKESRKKDVKDKKKIKTDDIDEEIHIGAMKSMIVLPAVNYKYKEYKQEYKLTIPTKGSYYKLDPDQYSKDKHGDFVVYDEKNKVIYTSAISSVLFATKQYPKLEPNQAFIPVALVLKKKEMDIVGRVVEMMPPEI